MKDSPLVSIITPSYNQGRYIEETILSVLNQDYSNLEYIVVDGGSIDNTLEILKKYETRLSWASEKDHGQTDALNKGFRMAKGEILGWLNSDDLYLAGAVKKIVQHFQNNPETGMVYGRGRLVDAEGIEIEQFPSAPFDRQRLKECCFICQPATFFRSSVFHAIGPLDENLHYCLDYEYWIRIAQRFRIDYLDEYLADARLQMEAKTVAQLKNVQEETLRVIQKYYKDVPAFHITAYAYSRLREIFMPNLQGVDKDGWAAQRVRVLLRGDWRPSFSLQLAGLLPGNIAPLRLCVSIVGESGESVQSETTLSAGKFTINTPALLDKPARSEAQTIELTIQAEKSFRLPRAGRGTNFRLRSYRIRKLAVIDPQGRETVIYSIPRALSFFFLQPLLFLYTFLRFNHSLPWTEFKQSSGQAWRYVKRAFVGS